MNRNLALWWRDYLSEFHLVFGKGWEGCGPRCQIEITFVLLDFHRRLSMCNCRIHYICLQPANQFLRNCYFLERSFAKYWRIIYQFRVSTTTSQLHSQCCCCMQKGNIGQTGKFSKLVRLFRLQFMLLLFQQEIRERGIKIARIIVCRYFDNSRITQKIGFLYLSRSPQMEMLGNCIFLSNIREMRP